MTQNHMQGQDAVAQEILSLGRNDQPLRLYFAWLTREIDDAALRELILPVWQLAEWPSTLGHRAWLEMFAATGFITKGDAELTYPVTVYRGAARSHARGFSWTPDRELAAWFAHRTALFGFPAALYELTLPKDMLLAVIGDEQQEGRGECEVIINPRRLRGQWSPREITSQDAMLKAA